VGVENLRDHGSALRFVSLAKRSLKETPDNFRVVFCCHTHILSQRILVES
jgi:hypothetical protein